MPKPEVLTMTQKDRKRLHIITSVHEKSLTQARAADCLDISERQVRRLLVRYRQEGDTGLLHRLRGRRSARRRSAEEHREILKRYQKDYQDFGPTLAAEKLLERDGIKISNESLRQLLLENGLWKRKRNRQKHRKWRERKAHRGEMVQMDGSHHDWLEGRGPKMVLMGYVDDATGDNSGQFYEYEGTIPAMDSMRQYIKKNGIPHSVYLDMHSTYKNHNAKPTIEDELNDRLPLSQFARALTEMEIKIIYAHSPQAKGRVERSFQTHQDRLVKELRLAKIDTLREANHYLIHHYWPRYNRKMSVPPAASKDLHQRVYSKSLVDRALSIRTEHTLRADRTIVHSKQWYQIYDTTSATKVVFEERYDGKISITYKGKSLRFQAIKKPNKTTTSAVKGEFSAAGCMPAVEQSFKVSTWPHQDDDRYRKDLDERYVARLVECR